MNDNSPRPAACKKSLLVVLDFDGFMVDSYELLKVTFEYFRLDVGDEARFQNRRKFLKYFGGGKEFLGNLVNVALPKKKRVRQVLTEEYRERGKLYDCFIPLLHRLIEDPRIHAGIVSRNYTFEPGRTIRAVLSNSGISESELDFVIPIPIGVKKRDVIQGMVASRYDSCILGADEIGDYRVAVETGYEPFIASYGFDHRSRLLKAGIPQECIYDEPEELARVLNARVDLHFEGL